MVDRFESYVSYVNSSERKLTFILEPWAEEFDLPAGSRLDLKISSKEPQEGNVFEQLDGGIVFYAGSESLVKVLIQGDDVSQGSADIETPSGASPFSFLKTLGWR